MGRPDLTPEEYQKRMNSIIDFIEFSISRDDSSTQMLERMFMYYVKEIASSIK